MKAFMVGRQIGLRVAQLRSIINKKGSTPEQIAEAKAELETLEGAPQRFTAGISRGKA